MANAFGIVSWMKWWDRWLTTNSVVPLVGTPLHEGPSCYVTHSTVDSPTNLGCTEVVIANMEASPRTCSLPHIQRYQSLPGSPSHKDVPTWGHLPAVEVTLQYFEKINGWCLQAFSPINFPMVDCHCQGPTHPSLEKAILWVVPADKHYTRSWGPPWIPGCVSMSWCFADALRQVTGRMFLGLRWFGGSSMSFK